MLEKLDSTATEIKKAGLRLPFVTHTDLFHSDAISVFQYQLIADTFHVRELLR
jgi:hypothetical protein